MTERSGCKGLSLLEVIISMLVLGILAVVAMRTVDVSSTMDNMQQNRLKTLYLAQRRMEQMLEMDYSDVAVGTTYQIYPNEVPGGPVVITTTVSDVDESVFDDFYDNPSEDPDDDYRQVKVSARWHQTVPVSIRPQEISLASYISPHVQTLPRDQEED